METNYIKAIGLDPEQPYSLGNKYYYYVRECNSGHTNLEDDDIAFSGGYYDGYDWAVPVCKRCINQMEDKRAMVYSHYTPFHLKQVNF